MNFTRPEAVELPGTEKKDSMVSGLSVGCWGGSAGRKSTAAGAGQIHHWLGFPHETGPLCSLYLFGGNPFLVGSRSAFHPRAWPPLELGDIVHGPGRVELGQLSALR